MFCCFCGTGHFSVGFAVATLYSSGIPGMATIPAIRNNS